MAISYVGISNDWVVQFAFATAWTLEKPSGVQAGDLLIGFLHAGSNWDGEETQISTLTPPTGWTTLRWLQAEDPNINYWVGYRIAESGDPSSWTNGVVSQTWSMSSITLAYRGVDTSNPFVVENGNATSADTNAITTPTVNNTVAGSWRVTGFCQRDGSANSWTSTDTVERGESEPHTNSWFMSGAVYDSNGTISTGNTSITGTSSGTFESAASWIGVLRDGSVQANAGHAAASVSSNAADPSTASSSGAPAVVFPSAVAGQSVAKVSARAGHASISVVANAVAEDNPGFGPAGSVAVQAVANDAAVVTSQLGIGQASVSVQGNPPVSFVGARVVWSVSNAPSGVNAQAGHAAVRVHSLE